MKVCTFNVNSVRARKDLLFTWLEQRGHDIDVLCLQELKAEDGFFPWDEFQDLGFSCEVFGQKTYNGVAICSKFPLKKVVKGFGEDIWDQQKRLIGAQIQDLILYNLYVPHGGLRDDDKYVYKQEWFTRLMAFLRQRHSPEQPLLLVGDFNVAFTEKDVYSAEALKDAIGTLPEEREAFAQLLSWGLTDVYRFLYPEPRQFTWWGYMGGAIWKDEGMRIDYALCTAPILDRITEAAVDLWPRKRRSPTPSDHAPLILTLRESYEEENHE